MIENLPELNEKRRNCFFAGKAVGSSFMDSSSGDQRKGGSE